MADEIERTQKNMQETLDASLSNAMAIITKDYLGKLESYEILEPTEEDKDIRISECGKFYKLSRLVLNKEENFLDKLTTIVNVVSSIGCSIATVVHSDGSSMDYYLGIVSKRARTETDKKRREADAAAFRGALAGNLIGSGLEELPGAAVEHFRDAVLAGKGNCYSSVSGIVALRDEENKGVKGYVQGIENLVDSLKGQEYTVAMVADPVDTQELKGIRQGYEMLYTQLSSFAQGVLTMNESDTTSLSKARTEGISRGISAGISMTQSRSRSKGTSFGVSAGIGLGIPAIANVNVGVNAGFHRGTADTTGRSDTKSRSQQQSKSVTDTTSTSRASGKSLQLTYENRSVKSLLEKIDKHLERLEECESFGAFDCAAYVIAKDRETALAAASNYNALMRGKDSGIQASHINSWYKEEETRILGQYIGSLAHPRFALRERPGGYQNGKIIVTPASIVSGNELAIQIGLPKKSISGVTVVPMEPFGRNIEESGNEPLVLGNLYHMGQEEIGNGEPKKVCLDMESLSMHTFITGSTGSGKSTAIYAMLDKLMAHPVKGRKENIKFLVIEPAKGEYKNRFGGYPNVKVYGTNEKKMPLLRMNPFRFPEDIHVLEHIDRLVEIFNVCWPMYAAMPAVLKDAIERAYILSGWNLGTSEWGYGDGTPLYPSFSDVLQQVHTVMEESAYSSDTQGDYKGALCTRLKSLTNGLYRQIFTSDELSPEELFESNVIVDLSRIGSSETRALIMGLLVMKLQEHRMANASGGNEPLRHVTVLEEAHNILKRTSMEQSGESANLLGKSVEMLANSIAEMRTYGEGFVIADQAPGLMDLSVIRNTNTKIILRLPDLQDRELVGRAAGLNEGQILELSRLKTFVAAVYQNNWLEPVLCSIDTNFRDVPPFQYKKKKADSTDTYKVLEFMLLPVEKRNQLDKAYVTGLAGKVQKLQMPAETKLAFLEYARKNHPTGMEDEKEFEKLRENMVYYMLNAEETFCFARGKENDVLSWRNYLLARLEPDITILSEYAQNQILTLLAKEKAQLDEKDESVSFFNRWMEYIEGGREHGNLR